MNGNDHHTNGATEEEGSRIPLLHRTTLSPTTPHATDTDAAASPPTHTSPSTMTRTVKVQERNGHHSSPASSSSSPSNSTPSGSPSLWRWLHGRLPPALPRSSVLATLTLIGLLVLIAGYTGIVETSEVRRITHHVTHQSQQFLHGLPGKMKQYWYQTEDDEAIAVSNGCECAAAYLAIHSHYHNKTRPLRIDPADTHAYVHWSPHALFLHPRTSWQREPIYNETTGDMISPGVSQTRIFNRTAITHKEKCTYTLQLQTSVLLNDTLKLARVNVNQTANSAIPLSWHLRHAPAVISGLEENVAYYLKFNALCGHDIYSYSSRKSEAFHSIPQFQAFKNEHKLLLNYFDAVHSASQQCPAHCFHTSDISAPFPPIPLTSTSHSSPSSNTSSSSSSPPPSCAKQIHPFLGRLPTLHSEHQKTLASNSHTHAIQPRKLTGYDRALDPAICSTDFWSMVEEYAEWHSTIRKEGLKLFQERGGNFMAAMSVADLFNARGIKFMHAVQVKSSGMSDRITNSVSTFWVCLRERRVFVLDPDYDWPEWNILAISSIVWDIHIGFPWLALLPKPPPTKLFKPNAGNPLVKHLEGIDYRPPLGSNIQPKKIPKPVNITLAANVTLPNPHGQWDDAGYLNLYPDLKKIPKIVGWEHYLHKGHNESRFIQLTNGRHGRWDDDGYLAFHPDVKAAGMSGWAHYRTYGHDERREIVIHPEPEMITIFETHPSIPTAQLLPEFYTRWESNRGFILASMDVDLHQEWFARYHLNYNTAYGCLQHALFQLRVGIIAHTQYESYLATLLNPSFYTISIHIRTGDGAFGFHVNRDQQGNTDQRFDENIGFFRCAQDLSSVRSESRRAANISDEKQVVWYLSSDSTYVKQRADQRWGLAPLTIPPDDTCQMSVNTMAQLSILGGGSDSHSPHGIRVGHEPILITTHIKPTHSHLAYKLEPPKPTSLNNYQSDRDRHRHHRGGGGGRNHDRKRKERMKRQRQREREREQRERQQQRLKQAKEKEQKQQQQLAAKKDTEQSLPPPSTPKNDTKPLISSSNAANEDEHVVAAPSSKKTSQKGPSDHVNPDNLGPNGPQPSGSSEKSKKSSGGLNSRVRRDDQGKLWREVDPAELIEDEMVDDHLRPDKFETSNQDGEGDDEDASEESDPPTRRGSRRHRKNKDRVSNRSKSNRSRHPTSPSSNRRHLLMQLSPTNPRAPPKKSNQDEFEVEDEVPRRPRRNGGPRRTRIQRGGGGGGRRHRQEEEDDYELENETDDLEEEALRHGTKTRWHNSHQGPNTNNSSKKKYRKGERPDDLDDDDGYYGQPHHSKNTNASGNSSKQKPAPHSASSLNSGPRSTKDKKTPSDSKNSKGRDRDHQGRGDRGGGGGGRRGGGRRGRDDDWDDDEEDEEVYTPEELAKMRVQEEQHRLAVLKAQQELEVKRAMRLHAAQDAVTEAMLLGLSEQFVFTGDSGFLRLPSYASLQQRPVYTLFPKEYEARAGGKHCFKLSDSTNLKELSSHRLTAQM